MSALYRITIPVEALATWKAWLRSRSQLGLIVASLFMTAAQARQAPEQPAAVEHRYSSHIAWEINTDYEEVRLVVTGDRGLISEWSFARDEPVYFDYHDADGLPLSDGSYVYELQLTPVVDSGVRASLEQLRASGESVDTAWLVETGALPPGPFRFSGGFTVSEGRVSDPTTPESDASSTTQFSRGWVAPDSFESLDQVIADDLIVQGSLCVGFDCVNNENFGFDTIRLKENNLRIGFDDTSTAAGFPANDWEITINDSASGGLNYFAVNDITAGRRPFLIQAGAPADSLWVAGTGRVGLRTATPVLDLHMRTGNTPGMRLEQDSSSGFTAQTWDVAGNEANFFIRDVTSGSRLPFRIRPGAPTSSIDIAANGNVGIGTASAQRRLHVRSADALFRLDRSSDTAAFLLVRTDGSFNPLKAFVVGTNAAGANNGEFIINDLGPAVGGAGTRRMTITNDGEAHFTGTVRAPSFVTTSSLRFKQDVKSLENAMEIVDRLQGVRFVWKETGKPSVGLIAEKVAEVIPEVVQWEGNSAEAGGVNYSALVAVLIEAVKEQQRTVDVQRQEMVAQQRALEIQQIEIQSLQDEVAELRSLQARITALERQQAADSQGAGPLAEKDASSGR